MDGKVIYNFLVFWYERMSQATSSKWRGIFVSILIKVYLGKIVFGIQIGEIRERVKRFKLMPNM